MEEPSVCTVADLLADPELGLVLVTPHADQTRPVRWVQTTELVDPTPYLRSGVLVCTVGASLTSDRAIRTFVAAVGDVATAICLGLGDVHEQVPPALTAACRKAGLPLMTLGYGVAFLALADVVERIRGQASEAQSLGRLIDLVHSGLARPESLQDALATVGLDPSHLVVAAWPPGSGARLTKTFDGGAVAETAAHTVTISASAESVRAAARATGVGCGYAAPTALADIASALSMAELALATGPADGDARGPDQVTSFGLVLEATPRERLWPFVLRIIDPLVAAGGHATPTYLDTLRAYLEHDLSVGRTAKAQYLHPNTVRHRLSLIKDLTGSNPFTTEGVLTLAVALWAHDDQKRR